MQASEINAVLENFPYFKSNFKGIFAIDQIPNRIKYREFLIGNTDIASGQGKHWFAVIKTKKGTIELFDSLGADSSKQQFYYNYCKNIKGINEILINSTQFQSSNTSTCGQFTMYFLINRLFNLDISFKQFLKISFVQCLEENEQIVEKFCGKI